MFNSPPQNIKYQVPFDTKNSQKVREISQVRKKSKHFEIYPNFMELKEESQRKMMGEMKFAFLSCYSVESPCNNSMKFLGRNVTTVDLTTNPK